MEELGVGGGASCDGMVWGRRVWEWGRPLQPCSGASAFIITGRGDDDLLALCDK